MRPFLICLIGVLFSVFSFAQTNVSGNITDYYQGKGVIELAMGGALSNAEWVHWETPKSKNGALGGFRVRTTDGEFASDTELTVKFDIPPINDEPYFDPLPSSIEFEPNASSKQILLTGLKGSTLESEALHISISSSDQAIIKNENISSSEIIDGKSTVSLVIEDVQSGVAKLDIRLSDGSKEFYRSIYVLIYEDKLPSITTSERDTAYVDYPFKLNFEQDSRYPSNIKIVDKPDWLTEHRSERVIRLGGNNQSYDLDGKLDIAGFEFLSNLTYDQNGDIYFLNNNKIKKISSQGGIVSTLFDLSQSGGAGAFAVDTTRHLLYFTQNNQVIKGDLEGNILDTVGKEGSYDLQDGSKDEARFGDLGELVVDLEGNVLVTDQARSSLRKIDLNLNVTTLIQSHFMVPRKDGPLAESTTDSNLQDVFVTPDGTIYFTEAGSSLLRKIDQSQNVSTTSLEHLYDVVQNYGCCGTVRFEPYSASKALVSLMERGYLLDYDLNDNTYEVIIGGGSNDYEENILAKDLNTYQVRSAISIYNEGILLSDRNNLYWVRPFLDSLQGSPESSDLGLNQIELNIEQLFGTTNNHETEVLVLENNKIEATNLNQTITFEEDTPSVNLDDIVLSRLQDNEEALVTIKLMPINAGLLTTDSGNDETFDAATGTWTMTGSQAAVNSALASIALIPTSDWDTDFEAEVVVVNAAGGVPNKGKINFKVTPIADIPRLVTELTDKAYAEIPYLYEFEVEDPDSYFFGFKINSYPDWLQYKDELWAETYAGKSDNSGNVNGDLLSARFDRPTIITKDNEGNLYVISNSKIRKIAKEGEVSTYAQGEYSRIVFDNYGNAFVTGNKIIRKINSNEEVSTIAGTGQSGFDNGPAMQATFSNLLGVDIDPSGNVYVLDQQYVRKLDTNGQVTTIAGNGSYGSGEGDALSVGFGWMVDVEYFDGKLFIAEEQSIKSLDLATNQVKILIGKNNNRCCNLKDSNENVYFNELNGIEVGEDGKIHAVTDNNYFVVDLVNNTTITLTNYNDYDGTEEGKASEVDFYELTDLVLVGNNTFLVDNDRHVIKRVFHNNAQLSGVPSLSDIGTHQIEYSLIDESLNEHFFTADIEVIDNDKPIISGMNQTYIGKENDIDIPLSGIALSKVESDSVILSFTLSNPKAGSFDYNEEQGSSFDPVNGKWTIKSKQTQINQVLEALQFHPTAEFHGKIAVKVETRRLYGMFLREEKFSILVERDNAVPELNEFTQIDAMVDLPVQLEIPITDGDLDPVDLKINGLPDWLQLRMEAVFEVSTLADMEPTSSISEIGDGSVSDIKMFTSGIRGLSIDSQGQVYFTNHNRLQRLKDGKVETLGQDDGTRRSDYLRAVQVVNDEIFVSNETAIFRVDNGELLLVAGGDSRIDKDGIGAQAGFSSISDFVSDGEGGFYVADTYKIRHVDEKGFVSTVAGTGAYGEISEGGNALELPLYGITHLQLDDDGGLLFGLNSQRKLCKYKDGVIEILFPFGSNSFSPVQYNVDKLGNVFSFNSNYIYLYDTIVGLKEYVNARNLATYQVSDGKEDEFQWSSVSQVIRTSPNSFYLLDRAAGDIRTITYKFKYSLEGTPPEGSEGTTTLTFKLNDGIGGEVTYQIPLNVAAPDNPKVTGFPQDFSYIEDAMAFSLDPIAIESQDESKEFKVRIDLGGERFGSLISNSFDLSTSLRSGVYEIKGNMAELNEILGTISYQPGLNNDLNSSIDFNFIQIGGNLSSDFKIPLSVTGVNDAPQIRGLSDTIAFVGDSLNMLLDIFDIEDGKNVSLTNIVKPDWLKIQKAEIQSEIIAGTLGVRGAKLGDAQSSILTQPQYVAEDGQKNLYISDRSLNSIFKLDQNGQLTLYAGSLQSGNIDGPRDRAQFYNPSGLAVDSHGTMYVADTYNNLIKKISSDGEVSTIAGSGRNETLDGDAEYAGFNYPTKLALSEEKGLLYIGEGRSIRVLDLQSKVVSTLPIQLEQDGLRSLSLAKNGDILFGSFNYVARYTSDGQLIRIIGSGNYGNKDGDYTVASFSSVESIAEDDKGNIFIYDQFGTVLRKISKDLQVSTLTGTGNSFSFNSHGNLLVRDNELIFAESGNNVVRSVKLDQYFISGRPSISDIGENIIQATIKDTEDLETNFDFKILVKANDRPNVLGQDTLLLFGEKDGAVELQKFEIVDSNDNSFEVFISAMNSSSISIGTTSTELIPFDNEKKGWLLQGKAADLNSKLGTLKGFSDSFEDETLKFRFSKAGGELDTVKTVILVPKPVNDLPVLTTQKVIEIVAGEEFNLNFEGTDPDKDVLTYTSSTWPTWIQADSVRMLQSFVDLAYSGNLPDSVKNKVSISAMAINQSGEIFTVSSSKNKVYKLLSNGEFELYAGNGNSGYEDGSRLEAEFYRPRSILFDNDDNLIIGDLYNTALRKIGPDGIVSTLVGGDRVLSSFNFVGRNGYKDEAKPFWIGRLAKDEIGNIYTNEYFSVGKFDLSGYYKTIAGKPGYNYDGYVEGNALDARFLYSTAIVPLKEDSLLIWDDSAGKLRRLSNEFVETISGADGYGYQDGNIKNARYGGFSASILLKSGEILVMDVVNYALRVLSFKEDKVSTVAGKGYFGNDFGVAEEVALGSVLDLLELENGDILLSELSKIKRLAYSVPKISGTPQLSDIGEHKFTLRISDGKDGIIEEEITINVIAPNALPTVTTIPNVEETFAVDKIKDIALFDYFSDVENSDSELTYEVVTNSDNSVVTTSAINSADGLLKLAVVNAGTTTLTLKATDTRGGVVTTSLEVVIAKAEASISISAASEIVSDGTEKEVVVITDPVDLSYTVTYNGLSQKPVSAGTYAVVATIDERNYNGEANFEFVILAQNTLPTVTTIPNVAETFAVDKTKDIALFDYFADVENSDSELTYEVVTNSDNSVVTTSTINSADGVLKLTVVNAGTTTLTLKATDTRGGTVTTSFEVNIAKAEATIEFGTLSFINTGEAKPVTVTTVPSGLNFTLTYAGQASAPSTVGTYALEATIDERNYDKVATAELAIVNVAPEAMALSANTIFENSAEATLIGEFSVTDQNPTDTHQYSLPTGTTDNGSFTITDAKLYASSSLNFEEKASYTVTVLVTDNHSATYQKEFTVTVTDVNEAPTIDAFDEIQVVKNLGSLSITLTGLSAGAEANQTITISSAKSGVIKSSSVTLSADKTTALLTFETETDQEGTGAIQVTVQDDGGTANGGIDTKTIDIPIKVLAPNVTVTSGSNCGPGSVSVSATGADSFKWYAAPLGGSSLSSEATYTIDLQTTSTFYVAGVVSGTESKLRVPVSASVFDALTAPVITNTDNVLSVTAVTGLSYQWMKDGVNIDGATANSFSPTESGNYSVVISNTNNCSATSVAEAVIITGTEDQLYTLAVNVYPVPSSDYVYLEFDETLRKGTKVQMVDNSGKQLVMKVLAEATNKLTIDVRKMPEGVHTIVVQDGAKLARKKILIQR